MSASRAQQLRGRQKAAALFIGLGPEISAEVMKHMRPEEVEAITREIMRMEQIDDHTKEDVFRELYDMALAHSFISTGGSEYAREMLVRAFGEEYAEEILRKVGMTIPAKPFEFLRKSDPRQLANFLQSEQPQTIALVLSHLPATQSAEVMSNFSDELQVDVGGGGGAQARTPPPGNQRRQGHQAVQSVQHGVVDEDGVREAPASVHDAVPDSRDARAFMSAECPQQVRHHPVVTDVPRGAVRLLGVPADVDDGRLS